MWQAVTRSTGIVATILIVAALASGFMFSARNTGRFRGPAWWLDAHNGLGGMAFGFTLVHVVASVLANDGRVTPVDAIVPGISPWGIGVGVVATYLIAAAVLTTWPRRLRRPRWWRFIHLGTVVAVAGSIVHAIRIGSSATAVWFQGGLLVLVAAAVYATGVRALSVLRRR